MAIIRYHKRQTYGYPRVIKILAVFDLVIPFLGIYAKEMVLCMRKLTTRYYLKVYKYTPVL